MTKRYCPGCGQPAQPGLKLCPICGKALWTEKPDFKVNDPPAGYLYISGARPAEKLQTKFSPGDRYTYEPPPPRRSTERRDEVQKDKPSQAGNYAARGQGSQGAYKQQPPRRDDIYRESPRRPESRPQGAPSAGAYRQESPRRENVSYDDIYRESPRRPESRPQGVPSAGGYRQEPPRRENISRDDIYRESPRRPESRPQGAPSAAAYRQEPPRRENVSYDDIYRESPRRSESRSTAKKPAAKESAHASRFAKFLDTSSKVVRVVVNTIKIAVLLAVIYFGIYLIEIYRVKLTGYPYDTTMRLSRSNYGQAISGYFAEGSWRVNPFTAKCTYKGKSNHNENMELIFSAAVHIELEEIRIDGEPVEARLLESKILGMFI